MASTRQAAKRPSAMASILGSFKSNPSDAKDKCSALHTLGNKKVIKLTPTPKARLSERGRLRQVMEDLAVIEGRHPELVRGLTASAKLHDGDASSILESSSYVQPPHTDLQISQFEIGKPLGRGRFGQVYLARHRITGYICALKVVSKTQCAFEKEEKLIHRELEVHQIMHHTNILRFYSWFHSNTSIYLILEYAPNGDLHSKPRKQPNGRFKEHEMARYITQIAEALHYMHNKNVIHQDIKRENILLDFRDEIKLADFGWSVHSESGFRSTVCGTLDYLSPEVAVMMLKPGQTDKWYTNAIGLWSVGVLACEMLAGKPPFETKSITATKKKIAGFKGKIKFPKHVSKGAEEFILQLLKLEAEKRMSLEEVFEHPWIKLNVGQAEGGVRRLSRLLERAGRA